MAPRKIGDLEMSDAKKIEKIIDSTKYVEVSKVNIPISDESYKKSAKIVEDINIQLITNFKNLNQEIISYCKNLIKEVNCSLEKQKLT